MAILTVPVTDLALAPAPNIEIWAYLSDVKGNHIDGATSLGIVIRRQRAVTDALGIATFDIVANQDIDQDGTFYAIDVAGSIAPIIIYKGTGSETLAQARVFDPADLGPAAALGDLWDVDTTGVNPGDTLRYSGGKYVPWAWPSGGGADKPWATINTNQAFIPADSANRYRVDAALAPIVLTLPNAIGNMAVEFVLKRVNSGPNLITVNTTSGQAIDGSLTFVFVEQWESATFSSDNANWMVT
jgi:hypothetical protein